VSSFYVPAESLLQSRKFRRLLVISLVGHISVYAALVLRPFHHETRFTASPVMVDLVAAPKLPPAPKPPAPKPAVKEAPKPEPAPPPPPLKPVVKEIVIPKEPQPLAKPKPKPVEAPPAPKKPEPPPPSAEELMAKINEKVEAQEAAKAPNPNPTEEANTPPLPGGAGVFDPVMAAWQARVSAVVRSHWSGASICQATPKFDVDVDAGGHLSNIELSESSGDKSCDETGERALRMSNPLPPPPRAISLTLNLNPKDNE